jgi:hypothetical protein
MGMFDYPFIRKQSIYCADYEHEHARNQKHAGNKNFRENEAPFYNRS